MSVDHSDRYEQAPVEGEYYDRKGFLFLKQYRRWAKIMTLMMSVILIAAVIHAMVEEQPGPFFIVFFIFVLIMGILGISYDHMLDAHKKKVIKEKERKRRILLKSILIRKKRLDLENRNHKQRDAVAANNANANENSVTSHIRN